MLAHLSIWWAFAQSQVLVSPARASWRVPFFVVLDQALASTTAVFASATALLFPFIPTKMNHVVLIRADNNDLHSQVLSSNIWSGPHWVGGQPQLEKKCCQQSLFKLVTIAVRTCQQCPPAVEMRLYSDGGTDLFHAAARNQLLVQNWHAKISLAAQVCNALFAFTYAPQRVQRENTLTFDKKKYL